MSISSGKKRASIKLSYEALAKLLQLPEEIEIRYISVDPEFDQVQIHIISPKMKGEIPELGQAYRATTIDTFALKRLSPDFWK